MRPSRVFRGAALPVVRALITRPAARWRRRKFIMRLYLNAWLARATVDVRLARDLKVGKRIDIQIQYATHTEVFIGPRSFIGNGVILWLGGGTIDLGEGQELRDNVSLMVTDGGRMTFDGPNAFGFGVTIHCADSVHLSKWVFMGEYATVVDSNHFYTEPDTWSFRNSKSAPIDIGVDVWICPRATVASGVTLGDRCVVASNTVVIRDAPAGSLISGVPGTVVREVKLPWREA